MKPLSSTLFLRSSSARKPILPLLNLKRDSKQQQKVIFQNKYEIFVKTSCLPIEINYSDQDASTRIYLSYNLVIIATEKQTKKLALFLQNKDWIRVDFGQSKSTIKVCRTGNENMILQNTLLGTFEEWEKINIGQKINTMYHLRVHSNKQFSIRKTKGRRQSLDLTEKQSSTELGQSKQIKKYVSSLVAKKFQHRFAVDKSHLNKMTTIKTTGKLKKNDITSDKSIGDLQSLKNTQSTVSYNHRLSRKSRVLAKNALQDSILTKNQSSWFGKDKTRDHGQPQSMWTLNLDESQIQKRLKKFETAKLIEMENIQNSEQNKKKDKQIDIKNKPINDEVEQEILVESRIEKDSNNFSDTFEKAMKKDRLRQQQSDLVQSKQLDSSGTIYQSRYQ